MTETFQKRVMAEYQQMAMNYEELLADIMDLIVRRIIDEIRCFSEIGYVADVVSPQTLAVICLHHQDKINEKTDLSLFQGKLSDKLYRELQTIKHERVKEHDKI